MTEASFWASLRKAAREAPEVVAWKLEDRFRVGLPDTLIRVWDRVALLELKYHAAWPKRSSTNLWTGLTPNQERHLLDWRGPKGNGLAFVLLGVDREWFLLDPRVVAGWEKNAQGIPGAREAEIRTWRLLSAPIPKWGHLFEYLRA